MLEDLDKIFNILYVGSYVELEEGFHRTLFYDEYT